MSKHTAGPWEVIRLNHADGDLWLSINAGQPGGMRPVIADVKYLTSPDEEQWANARLLAAAPDLLEALRVAHAAISTLDEEELGTGSEGEREWFIRDEVLVKLAAAIAKAEGRESER